MRANVFYNLLALAKTTLSRWLLRESREPLLSPTLPHSENFPPIRPMSFLFLTGFYIVA